MTTQSYQLARNADPSTSHEAADYMVISGKLGRDQKLVYDCICDHPGMVAGELLDYLGMLGLWKRVNELHKLKLITYGAKRVYKGTGRSQLTLYPVNNTQRQLPL